MCDFPDGLEYKERICNLCHALDGISIMGESHANFFNDNFLNSLKNNLKLECFNEETKHPLNRLREALIKYSPLRQIFEKETSPDIGLAIHLVETGESRTFIFNISHAFAFSFTKLISICSSLLAIRRDHPGKPIPHRVFPPSGRYR